MSSPPERHAAVLEARCPAVNEVQRLRCDREPGHPGAHVEDYGWAQVGWGWSGDGRVFPCPTPCPGDCMDGDHNDDD